MVAGGISFSAALVSRVHTACASLAFLTALAFGLLLHYKKIVKNDVAGYPDEWWPSVSATIGDWYPERNLFQILIALTSGPRFALVACWYLVTRNTNSSLPEWVMICGLLRTISCGGWVYITSSDDGDIHDFLMISYIVLNVPWMIGSTKCTTNLITKRKRKLVTLCFFGAIPPMIFFYMRHKVKRIPGAYTHYSFFEWFLIFADIYFDSITVYDFEKLEIVLGERGVNGTMIAPSKEECESTKAKPTPPQVTEKSISDPRESSDQPQDGIPTGGPAQVAQDTPKKWAFHHPFVSFIVDSYLSYVWWSIMTSLAPSLFYFSVWELAIAGSEAAILALLSPFLLSSRFLRNELTTRQGRTILHILSLVGLIAFISKKPMIRLLMVSFANVVATINQGLEWIEGDPRQKGLMLGIGLMITSVLKLMNHSNNPIWPIVNAASGGYNFTGLVLALLAILERSTRPEDTDVWSEPSVEVKADTLLKSPSTWPAALSLGALLYGFHAHLGDSGTLIAWSWTGYPIQGPIAGVHNPLIILSMALGLLLASLRRSKALVSTPAYLAFGAMSMYTLYSYQNWLGFLGGCAYTTFLCSLVSSVISNVVPCVGPGGSKTGRVLGGAWLVYALFVFADVWTVAYAFVPGGVYLRERTNVVLAVEFACLALGLSSSQPSQPSSPKPHNAENRTTSFPRALIIALFALSVSSTLTHLPLRTHHPHRSAERLITAGIWTVHFGIDLEGRDSQRRIRNLIRDMELDVLGLLESDLNRIVYGNRDLTKVVAEELGYYVDLGPGPNSHTWGAALFSKFPILNSTHHLLPSPRGELAPAISAVLDAWGTRVLVVVSHNGQEEDPLDRELQSAELARIMAEAYPMPTIFLGYVVTKPHAPRPSPYEILTTDGKMHDIDGEDMERWCEYILYRGMYRTGYGRMARGNVTDTELQLGKFVLPPHGQTLSDQSHEDRYRRSFKEDLPERWWFNDSYYGNGDNNVNGHYWHVFGTPLYYKLPEDAVML